MSYLSHPVTSRQQQAVRRRGPRDRSRRRMEPHQSFGMQHLVKCVLDLHALTTARAADEARAVTLRARERHTRIEGAASEARAYCRLVGRLSSHLEVFVVHPREAWPTPAAAKGPEAIERDGALA